MGDSARSALRGEPVEPPLGPDRSARLVVVTDEILRRVPGDVSFLMPRLLLVLQGRLHRPLPVVTQASLWDLLAFLLMAVVDRSRGASNADASRFIDEHLAAAAQKYKITGDEVKLLLDV